MRVKSLILGFVSISACFARGAVISASGDATGAQDAATIQAALDTAKTSGGTVTLGNGIYYINKQLLVDGAVTLEGQGWDKTVVKQVAAAATATTRVMTVSGGATVKQLAMTGGRVYASENNKCAGGAFLVDGTISWCCISNNQVSCNNSGYGGGIGIYSGKGRIDHCVVSDNLVTTSTEETNVGGGIGIYGPIGEVTIDACLIQGNRASNTTRHYSGKGAGLGALISFTRRALLSCAIRRL